MSDEIQIEIAGAEKLLRRLRSGAATVTEALRQEMEAQMSRAADWSRANKLSGSPLHRRTGQLSRSIVARATVSGSNIKGTLGSSVPYGKVHERGGTFKIREHSRRNARGKTITVREHEATFPARPFLKPALMANRQRIINALRSRIAKAVTGAE